MKPSESTLSQNGNPTILSVTELNRQARRLLEGGLGRLWVEGEVSNVARPASGHVYFSLKDGAAQLRCAWFRQRQRGPTIGLKNGSQMQAFGQISIYEARGDYQLIVERVEAAGEGELRRRFEELKKKLAAEGLFDDTHKRELPSLPAAIGVVTSPSGAAIRDIVSVLRRRFPLVPVRIYPTAVQGDAAAPEIVAAIDAAVRRDECDVLIVARGGGSLEDLWPFNEEAVARALHRCPLPVISAVGHEVDFTIADFVADVRAPTPSGAAELVVPDRRDWQRQFAALGNRISALGRRRLQDWQQTLDWLARRLNQSSPAATVNRQTAWLTNLQQMLAGSMRHRLSRERHGVERIRGSLLRQSPALRVQRSQQHLAIVRRRLVATVEHRLQRVESRLRIADTTLNSVSPLATLERGYAIVTDANNDALLVDAAAAPPGTEIRARLASGSIDATVTDSHATGDTE